MSYKYSLSNAELCEIKRDICLFSDQIKILSNKNSFNCKERDLSFFLFMGKHIVFYKYLAQQKEDHYFIVRIISDIFHLIHSLICGETRYAYLHERSLIENLTRFVISEKQENHFTDQVLLKLKKETNLSEDDFSLIKSEYKTACDFVHGGSSLDNTLSQVLEDCFNKYPFPRKELNAYYGRIQRLITIFDWVQIQLNPDFISSSFHRKKNILEYLIGKKQRDKLHNRLMEVSNF